AIIGLVVGALGLVAAIVALARGRRPAAPAATAPDTDSTAARPGWGGGPWATVGPQATEATEARQVTLESRSPQRPDDLVVKVEAAGTEAVAGAVERAREAGGGWAAAPALERSAALAAAADALAGEAGEVTGLVVREV